MEVYMAIKIYLQGLFGAVLLIICIAGASPIEAQVRSHPLSADSRVDGRSDDPVALGHPLSFWMNVIRDRDLDNIDRAFDAIVVLGPAASKSVPELMGIVAAPFTPVRIERDSRKEVLTKILEIHVRSGAVDGLGAIGHAAAPAAEALLDWGLTLRVLPPDGSPRHHPLYLELVAIDVLERMRVAGTVARLGSGAAPAVQKLIESKDDEKRKLAVAILSDAAVSIATDLMGSSKCENRILGLSLLTDMWPVVAKENLMALRSLALCDPEDPDQNMASRKSIIEAIQ